MMLSCLIQFKGGSMYDKNLGNYTTDIISFMPLEPQIPSHNRYDSYLEREMDEYNLRERYKKTYENISF